MNSDYKTNINFIIKIFKLMCHINHIHFYVNLFIILLMCYQSYSLIITFTLVYKIFVVIFFKREFS